MKLEDQVCTLEQAKKLQKLGMKADSCFNYAQMEHGFINRIDILLKGAEHLNSDYENYSIYPAYTVAELGEMLPYEYLNYAAVLTAVNLNPTYAFVTVWKTENGWRFRGGPNEACSKPMPEAEARAAMLIHLIETGIVSSTLTTQSHADH